MPRQLQKKLISSFGGQGVETPVIRTGEKLAPLMGGIKVR